MSHSKVINATRQYDSITTNGAITHGTSLSKCLDFFFIAGASRNMDMSDIITAFTAAYNENKVVAYQILFWARDCRGGAGEKRLFYTVAKHVNKTYPQEWEALSIVVHEYGSWKDYFVIEDICDDSLGFLMHQLEEHSDAHLLAKWFPRKGEWFNAMFKYKKMTPKEFRKYLVSKTDVVENKVCNNDWSSIDYSKIPSVAFNKYRDAFTKHDKDRFNTFIESVLDGKETVNSAVLFPYQLFLAAMQVDANVKAIEAQWKALPNYMEGSTERILPVCDVSGSMTCRYGEGNRDLTPMSISVSLGLYIAERNEGLFKDAFITFSERPRVNYVVGNSIVEKFNSIERSDWGMTTNLEATFDLLLDSALRESISEDEMPTKLLIISDMEFDEACDVDDATNLDSIRLKYDQAGYTMPEIIFWNVNGRLGNIPASKTDEKVGLVSGCSPAILTGVLQGQVETPLELMLKVVDSERYRSITGMLAFLCPDTFPPETYPNIWKKG